MASRAIKKRQAEKALRKLGFDIRKDGRHVRATITVDGRKVAATGYSHGKGDLVGRFTQTFRKQLHLNQEQFDRAVDCPLQHPEYVQILRDQGMV